MGEGGQFSCRLGVRSGCRVTLGAGTAPAGIQAKIGTGNFYRMKAEDSAFIPDRFIALRSALWRMAFLESSSSPPIRSKWNRFRHLETIWRGKSSLCSIVSLSNPSAARRSTFEPLHFTLRLPSSRIFYACSPPMKGTE